MREPTPTDNVWTRAWNTLMTGMAAGVILGGLINLVLPG